MGCQKRVPQMLKNVATSYLKTSLLSRSQFIFMTVVAYECFYSIFLPILYIPAPLSYFDIEVEGGTYIGTYVYLY